ncbi:MAG: hypothetical protein ACJ8C4_13410 [Gemmataceae bacterium]
MDGILKRVSANCWRGELGGYRIEVAKLSSGWTCWIFATANGTTAYTRLVLQGESIAAVARKAREWIETTPYA